MLQKGCQSKKKRILLVYQIIMILDNVSLFSEHMMLIGRAKIGRGSLEKEAVMWKVI